MAVSSINIGWAHYTTAVPGLQPGIFVIGSEKIPRRPSGCRGGCVYILMEKKASRPG